MSYQLTDSVQTLPGIGPARAKRLEKLGITTARDLLLWYPRNYEDRRETASIAQAPEDKPVCVKAMVATPPRLSRIRKGLELVKVNVVDDESAMELTFFIDGGDYYDEKRGRNEHFAGGLFDETVFNDSVREFLNKRLELADYFDESHDEDIFDYIPPQKTNQIFTPRWVVKKMVDALEEENPGCFDDPDATFADLYMKSGLYITEVVKRLFASEGLKATFPDETDRICHIIENQVYGMAPTRIIYLIATNYILGFDELMKATNAHFVQADAAEASKNGTLQELVQKCFGK